MLILYNVLLLPIQAFWKLLTIFHRGASDFQRKRNLDKENLGKLIISENVKVIWLHAASVGELDQCKAIAGVIKSREKETLIVLSVFSESVSDKQMDSPLFFASIRLPLDFDGAYDFYFKKFHPQKLIIAAWDTWPNLIKTAKKYNCKTYLACGTLSDGKGRTGFFGKYFFKSVFSMFDGISPTTEKLIPAFTELAKNCKIISCGDSRFDSVAQKIESQIFSLKRIEFHKIDNRKIIVFASTYKECDDVLSPLIEELIHRKKTIWIFPHKINESRIKELESSLMTHKVKYEKYSNCKDDLNQDVVLFDEMGILAFAYQEAEVAYVGGALHNRVHNVIEPAYFGLAVVTGKKIQHSAEAISLENSGGLFTANTTDGFRELFNKLGNPELIKRIKNNNTGYVKSSLGASIRFYNTFLKDTNEKI